MKHLLLSFLFVATNLLAQDYPLKGFCIEAPDNDGTDAFIKFINEELAPRKINTLILRVDYNYEFTTHPELRTQDPLTRANVNKLVEACARNQIRLIPQINLLGHQSWAGSIGNLLRVYPQFDETPHVKMPEKYEWPNADGLYCKSYCPLHPDVHKVLFEIVDEVCDAFKSNAFHAGMDEVFYLGDDKCPRCGGRDKAELFAGEVRTIRDHLASKGRTLWIWGDRLIDGKTTGMGMWEASFNNTHRAVDMIPKDVMICDWHYERPDKTAVYFAMKGFKVATCPWQDATVALQQSADMVNFRRDATEEMRENYQGIVQTVWSGAQDFLDGFYSRKKDKENTAWNCFNAVFPKSDQTNKK